MPEDHPLPEIVPVTPPDAEARLSRAIRQVRHRRRRRAGVALSAVAVLAIGSSVTALSLGGHGNNADRVATLTATSTPASTAPTTPPCPTSSPPSASTDIGRTTMNNRTRATLAAVALTSAVTACGTTTPKPTATPTTPGGATSTGSTPASGPPATTSAPPALPAYCLSRELRVVYDPGQGAGGSQYSGLHFFNKGSRACTVTGYPGVAFAAPNSEKQVGQPAERRGSGVSTIMLAPGAEATSLLVTENVKTTGCSDTPVAGLRVYPPSNTDVVYVPFMAEDTICAQTVSTIYPLRSGAAFSASGS